MPSMCFSTLVHGGLLYFVLEVPTKQSNVFSGVLSHKTTRKLDQHLQVTSPSSFAGSTVLHISPSKEQHRI